jgi:16S rRNA (cytidine1402-2'-O)-methyltransferase
METLGILYIVATPIGNLSDITLRALEILKNVDLIACEDTRVTIKLLNHYGIKKPLIAYHQHSKLDKIETIINRLKEGKNIGLVTDAGTPGLSDPGNILVGEAVRENITIMPIPGASALTALISVAGIDMQRFIFLGFPPHKKGRETFFREVGGLKEPVVYFDSPYRLIKNLELLQKFNKKKKVIIGRELTKMFEEVIRGETDQALGYFSQNKPKIKGELVIIAY